MPNPLYDWQNEQPASFNDRFNGLPVDASTAPVAQASPPSPQPDQSAQPTVTLTPVDYDPFGGGLQMSDQSGVATPIKRLFGLDGQERYQTWPERMLRSAATLVPDVMSGKLQVNDPETNMPTNEVIQRSQDLAGLMGGGGFAKVIASDTVKPAMALSAMKDAPIFYSAVEHAVDNIKQNKAPGDQWLATISNSKGVKPEELDWTGLKEFLAEKGKEPVNKEEIQKFVDANKVELKEVNKGIKPDAEAAGKALAESHGNTWSDLSRVDQERYIRKADNRSITDYGGDPKYSKYQLPGGENYREKLLTLPDRSEAQLLREEAQRRGYPDSLKDWPDKEFAQKYRDKVISATDVGTYKSSHWDEPNILAHVRMNDRPVIGAGESEPVKSLHMEEIQSDWHQQGREKGYKNEKDTKGWRAEKDPEGYAKDWLIYDNNNNLVAHRSANTAEEAITNATRSLSGIEVPDAPFKKTWHELALKRMIREAAEKGYDRLSWTPGEAQAARYDLSKQVDAIIARKNEDGTYNINARMPQGNHIGVADKIPENKIADHVGKELADKIVKDPFIQKGLAAKEYSGLDLKVGGEGMKGFYDQMIPKSLEKIGKEHGVKVKQGVTKTDATDANFDDWRKHVSEKRANPVHYIDIPKSMRDTAMHKGFPLFSGGIMLTPVDHDPFESKKK